MSHDKPLSSRHATALLPAELFYPICARVVSRRDLLTLSATSRILQRPAESQLHQKIISDSRDRGRMFVSVVKQCPRFAPLVRELHLEPSSGSRDDESMDYWVEIHDVLGSLSALNRLIIDDGRDEPWSWVLSALPANRLRVLHCAFILDVSLLRVLRQQSMLEEFAWKGGLIGLPISRAEKTADIPRILGDLTAVDPEGPLISVIRQYLDPSALPCLKYLTSESLALARALVPGRVVTHLWVPGAAYSESLSSDYLNDQVSFRPKSDPALALLVEQIQLARPRLDASSIERSDQMRRAIRDFGLSRGPVLSLRMQFDLYRPELMDVLSYTAQNLPALRTIGFLPAYILEPASKELDEDESSPLPPFKQLHTLCLSSKPSRKAVTLLQRSSNHLALRTIACLHYSQAFEWLCLPVNDNIDPFGVHQFSVEWNTDARVEMGVKRRIRRVTPVHDPGHRLWRVV